MSPFSGLPSEESLDVDLHGDAEEQVGARQFATVMNAALAERLQLEELSVSDDETAALAWQYAEYATSPADTEPHSKPLRETSFTAVGRQSEPESQRDTASSAQQLFEKVFPSGYKILQTPGTNMRCGIYAMILSYENQYPSRAIKPTINTLMDVKDSAQYREVVSRPQSAANAHEANLMVARQQARQQARTRSEKKKIGEDIGDFLQNDRYFSPDQLDLLLRLWGESQGLRLRLGYLHGQEAKLLGRDQDDERADVVWIHFRSRGAGHYSGLTANSGLQRGPAGNRGRGLITIGRDGGNMGRGSGKHQQRFVSDGKRMWTRR